MKNICIGIDISKETFDVTLIFVKNMAEFNSGYTSLTMRLMASVLSWPGLGRSSTSKGHYGRLLFSWRRQAATISGFQLPLRHNFSMGESALQIALLRLQSGKNDKTDSLNIANYAARTRTSCRSMSRIPRR